MWVQVPSVPLTWGSMYQGWRDCFASNLWWVRFPSTPLKNKKEKMKVENKEVISGSFESSKIKLRPVYDNFSLLTALIKIVKKRKQKLTSKV
jgi:hypothetical protein